MINKKLPKIWYGGDYNPDQWPKEIWHEDMRLFKKAYIDVASLPVFSWSLLQPEEERYDFEWLDEILDLMAENGIYACLATSTAAHPAWMARRYPDILRVDFQGRKHRFGQRHNSCPNSPTYRKYAPRLAAKLAERYKDHPTLVAWHVSNEYGGVCYCDNCAKAFRVWLQKRYGTIEEVNRRWNTRFWNHTFYDWDEIVPPNILSEHMSELDPTRTAYQGISLDYSRFMSDSLLECYKLEYEAIKEHTPDVMVTTNFMGTYKPLNYFAWAPLFGHHLLGQLSFQQSRYVQHCSAPRLDAGTQRGATLYADGADPQSTKLATLQRAQATGRDAVMELSGGGPWR